MRSIEDTVQEIEERIADYDAEAKERLKDSGINDSFGMLLRDLRDELRNLKEWILEL